MYHVTRNSRALCNHSTELVCSCTYVVADQRRRVLADPWMGTTGPLMLFTPTIPAITPLFMEVCRGHGPIRLEGMKLKAHPYVQMGVQPLKPRLEPHLKTNLMDK